MSEAAGGRNVRAWGRHLGDEPGDLAEVVAGLGNGSLPDAFAATAAAHPDRPALAIGEQRLTHGELDRRAVRLAAALAARGAQSRRRVLLSGETSAEYVIAYLAILRTGATLVLAGAGLTEPELDHLVGDSEATLAIAQGPALSHLARIREDRGGPALLALDGGGADAAERLDELPVPVTWEPPPVTAVDVALLAYTSGTTGKPKGVPLTHRNLLASIRAAMLAWRWSPDDVLVHALPLTHQHGLAGVHTALLSGSRTVVRPRFDPEDLLDTLRAEHATVLFGVPAMYERLTTLPAAVAPPPLRLVVSGSAPLSPALAARAAERFGQVPLERYGTTESGLDVSNPYEGPRRPGTVGLPLPGVELDIVDARGRSLPDGEDGEIVLRGPQVFAGYLGQPAETASAFLPGGWFRTGDVGRIDPGDGYLSITGRLKELIISGGLNVYPREVEQVVEEHPAVARAGVVGLPSERWGEEVVAAVVLAPGIAVLPEAELTAHARARLSAYKCPKRWVAVEDLPVNALGKVVRADLVHRLGAELTEK